MLEARFVIVYRLQFSINIPSKQQRNTGTDRSCTPVTLTQCQSRKIIVENILKGSGGSINHQTLRYRRMTTCPEEDCLQGGDGWPPNGRLAKISVQLCATHICGTLGGRKVIQSDKKLLFK